MQLRLNDLDDVEALAAFYQRNAGHLQPWEPLRDPGFHTPEAWRQRLRERLAEFQAGESAHFLSWDSAAGRVVAVCSLTDIARGAFQAGYLGYAVCLDYQGQGHMKALCRHVVDFAFGELALNRVMANYMPRNKRSEQLLMGLGFEREGLARNYLCINGRWEDHVLTSRINPENDRQSQGGASE